MEKTPWLLSAVVLDGKGGAKRLTEEELKKRPTSKNNVLWVHLNLKKYASLCWLKKEAKLEPWVSEILTDTQESRPRALFHKNSLLLVLRTVSGKAVDLDDMVVLRMWVTHHRIITVQSENIPSLKLITRSLERRRGPKDIGELLEAIIDTVLMDISRSVSELEYEMDDIEEAIISHTEDKQALSELADLQRQLVSLRRYLAPSKEAFDSLHRGKTLWFDEDVFHLTQESLHRMQRILEDVDLLRERGRINHEVLQAHSVRQNQRNMYMISVLATLFLPLSFLTGLFGMNVGGIPFSTHPHGIWLVSGFIFFTGFLLILVFKKLKWM